MKSKKESEKRERALILAERIKLLFSFVADLIADKDLIKEAENIASRRQSFALSAAPILGAFGQDYEEAEFEARLRADRAEALYNLVDVLDRTECERAKFRKKQTAKAEGREQLKKILGL